MVSIRTTFSKKETETQGALTPDLLKIADSLIEQALLEDLNDEGDITCEAIVPNDISAKAIAIAKEPGVIAGLPFFERVFKRLDPNAKVSLLVSEGTQVQPSTHLCRIEGAAGKLLAAERTALNILQRLCGIASRTREFAELAKTQGISILDTRKTTPGLRALEKYAVVLGGGVNHRLGLYDAILIKDNHIAIAGGVTEAINRCRMRFADLPVEVEVTNFQELEAALRCGVEKIMLDNMTPGQIQQAVEKIDGRAFIEVSGGVNAQNLPGYLIEGVDAISIGALTHSTRSMDISLEIEVWCPQCKTR